MTANTIKNIIMVILLICGMACLMKAKIDFQHRQQQVPDNQWSPEEDRLRKIGYAIMILDVIIAGFISV